MEKRIVILSGTEQQINSLMSAIDSSTDGNNIPTNLGVLSLDWDFIERYHPNYYSSNRVAYALELHKILTKEYEDNLLDSAYEILMDIYDGDINNESIAKDYEQVLQELYKISLNNFLNK